MSSIAQIYELEFKNLLKEKLSNIISDISDNLIQNILNPSEVKYIKILSDLEENIKELLLKILVDLINFFNDNFTNSKERKDFYHINIRNDHRSIMTSIGTLEFYRTYFESKDRTKHFYFIDQLLGIDKYARYDCNTKANSISLATKTNQKLSGELALQNINSSSSNTLNTIPRQTINRWIKTLKVPIIQYDPISIQGDTLYIMADEKWIHEQIYGRAEEDKGKHKFIMSKEFVCFSGIEQKKNKRILNDRFVFITSSDTPWDDFLDIVTTIYDFEKLNKIIFLSDAGKWLISGASDLKMFPHNKIIMCLCEFHVRQKVNRITTDQDYRDKLNKAIDEDKKKVFKSLMEEIKDLKKENPKRLEKLQEYENYILNHWKKIKNMAESPCKSSMESHISHYIASYFSSRPKAYSRNNIENHLKLQEAKINGIDIKSLFLKSYKNSDTITYNQKELNFSIFEKSSSSNIPALESGNFTSLFSVLSSLAHLA